MKKRLLLSMPICLFVFYGQTQIGAQGVECERRDTPPVCQNGGRININTIAKNISPRNLCATPGQSIDVIVTPAGSTARIEGKNGGWPRGSGSSFTIVAPADGIYAYNVFFEDNTCIDPQITVGGR